jgi:uroporphyrinogen-III synthase
MRLIVTRAEPEAGETAARLIALGHEALIVPLSRIIFSEPPASPIRPDAIAVTSRNGVRALAGWRQARDWRGVTLYAVGAATAEEARRAGFKDVRKADGDAAALGRLVIGELKPGGSVLYAAARDRMSDLAAVLRAAGFTVDVVEAYRAETVAALPAPAAEAIRSGRIDGVLFHSRRTAEAFLRLAREGGIADRLSRLTFYVLSSRVGEPLAASGGRVMVAERPDDESLMALIAANRQGWPRSESPV